MEPFGFRVKIESRGTTGWVISDGSSVMNEMGDFEYEPFPSSRTDEFIARTRFATPEAALEHFRQQVEGSEWTEFMRQRQQAFDRRNCEPGLAF